MKSAKSKARQPRKSASPTTPALGRPSETVTYKPAPAETYDVKSGWAMMSPGAFDMEIMNPTTGPYRSALSTYPATKSSTAFTAAGTPARGRGRPANKPGNGVATRRYNPNWWQSSGHKDKGKLTDLVVVLSNKGVQEIGIFEYMTRPVAGACDTLGGWVGVNVYLIRTGERTKDGVVVWVGVPEGEFKE